jgi:peptidoglycan hydrolase CwlO-like protein
MKKTLQLILVLTLVLGSLYQQPVPVFSQTKSELQQELEAVEQLIKQYENELASTREEKKTLTNKINQLKKEQTKIQLEIRSTNLLVSELETNIATTEQGIISTSAKIEQLKQGSANLLRSLYQDAQMNTVELMLSAENLTDAVDQIVALETLSEEVLSKAKEMKAAKIELGEKQELMEQQQEEAKDLLKVQSLQEAEFRSKVAEQNEILVNTKGVEEQYQAMLNESKKKAGQIRMRLYEMAGGGSSQVTFGQAVEIAKSASAQTGVRAAFLLAILTQESNLGKNVGTCNRPGDPPEKNWRNIMHPTRDLPKFEAIVKELGLDPETTPVSCPMMQKGKRVGWGGAMGPAQFIPSTWMGYKDKVAAITGKPANPWDIRDAFLAAAIKLAAGGATRDGRKGEWNAAMRYFSGSTNPRFRFYGDNVLKTTDRYQAELDALAN